MALKLKLFMNLCWNSFHQKNTETGGHWHQVQIRKMWFHPLFTLLSGDGASGCLPMTDSLGRSRELNEHLALVIECSTQLATGEQLLPDKQEGWCFPGGAVWILALIRQRCGLSSLLHSLVCKIVRVVGNTCPSHLPPLSVVIQSLC